MVFLEICIVSLTVAAHIIEQVLLRYAAVFSEVFRCIRRHPSDVLFIYTVELMHDFPDPYIHREAVELAQGKQRYAVGHLRAYAAVLSQCRNSVRACDILAGKRLQRIRAVSCDFARRLHQIFRPVSQSAGRQILSSAAASTSGAGSE